MHRHSGETIFNQSFNYGVERIQNSLAISPTDSSNTAANIRGLGTAATLDLMNNKRGSGNANYNYPMIAVQRIEALLDGASAIYGSNAVAGVVNYVPYTQFDGMKLKLDYRSRVDGGFDENIIAFMFGGDYDRGNFVAAFEKRDRSALRGWDIPDVLEAAAMFSYQGHPGRWQVPGHGFTDANGVPGNLDTWGPAKSIPSSARWDRQYGYTSEGLIGNDTTEILLGVNNVFDKEPYVFNDGGGFESYLTDPVVAIWYLRLNHTF